MNSEQKFTYKEAKRWSKKIFLDITHLFHAVLPANNAQPIKEGDVPEPIRILNINVPTIHNYPPFKTSEGDISFQYLTADPVACVRGPRAIFPEVETNEEALILGYNLAVEHRDATGQATFLAKDNYPAHDQIVIDKK